jgi:hypothetical protein
MTWTDADVVKEEKPKQLAWSDDDIAVSPEPTITDEFKKKSAISLARGERPYLAKLSDFLAGASGISRGAIKSVSPELANRLMPTEGVDKKSARYIAGELLDPAAWAIGGGAGNLAAKVLPKVGPVTQGLLGGASGGAAIGALSEEGTAGTGGLVGGILGSAIPVAGKMAGGVADILTGRRADIKAGKILKQASKGKEAQTEQALLNARPGETTSQAIGTQGNREIQALEESFARPREPNVFGDIYNAQEANRMASLRGVTPNLKSAEADRTTAAAPLYTQAKQQTVTLDQPMMDIFERMPKGTLEAAANIARMDGRPFVIGKYTPAQQVPSGLLDSSGNPILVNVPAQYPKITGESLHYIKRALSDISNAVDPAKGIGRDSQNSARGVLSDFLSDLENRVLPVYGSARTTFAAKSAPVNQSKVLSEMQNVLAKETGGERVQPFLNVLGRGEQALLKRSTGFPRYESGDLANVLTQNQMGTVNRVAGELRRDAELGRRATEGSESAQEILKKNMLGFQLPNVLQKEVTVTNRVAKFIDDVLNEKTKKSLTQAMIRPDEALRVLRALPYEDQQRFLLKLKDPELASTLAASLSGASQ